MCKGFAMIPRDNPNNNIKITKEHSLIYYNHTYYIKNSSKNNLIKGEITKNAWSHEKIRFNLFKWYFNNLENSIEDEWREYKKNLVKVVIFLSVNFFIVII